MPLALDQNTALSFACLNFLTKKRYDFLLQEFETLEKAWTHLDQELLKKLGCKEDTILKLLNEKEELDLDQHLTYMQKNNIELLTIDDMDYPDELRNIADPPVFLFAKGNIALLNEPSIAIVGTRAMSSYGKRVVEELVPAFVRAGLTTVSGLALGIDAEVAKETMHADGNTIAVLGHGLAAMYPRSNARLADTIVEKNGLLLTEFPLQMRPDKYTFPSRNRIIAGLSLGTIVAEAADQSGSLITASLALEYGREVFAVPGQIFDKNYEGAHHLIIKGGARLITNAEDILTELGIVAPEAGKESTYHAQTPEEQTLLERLSSMPQSVNDLVEKSEISIALVNSTLTLMELKGGAKNVGMGMWVRL